MNPQISRFNRILLILLVILFVLSLAFFGVMNWRAERAPQITTILLSSIILSFPLLLVYGSIYILLSAWHEHHLTGQISPRKSKVIYYAPRAASVVIIFFISLFSLDVFSMQGTFLQLLGGFILHSLPSIFLILLLVFAWRRPVIGFAAFFLAGLYFLRFVVFGGDLPNFLLFSGPLFLTSGLFFADWRWNQPHTPAPKPIQL